MKKLLRDICDYYYIFRNTQTINYLIQIEQLKLCLKGKTVISYIN